MFNNKLKEDVKNLTKIVRKLEEPVLGHRYNIHRDEFMYTEVTAFGKIEQAIQTVLNDNQKLHTELKKTKALLNEVIDYVYSKDES